MLLTGSAYLLAGNVPHRLNQCLQHVNIFFCGHFYAYPLGYFHIDQAEVTRPKAGSTC